MKLSPTMKWILGAFGAFILLFLCVVPIMARVFFIGVGRGFDAEEFWGRRGAFAQTRDDTEAESAQPGGESQEQNYEETVRKGWSSRGYRFGHHGRHGYGRGGFSLIGAIFALFGGLIRLAGLGLLGLAAIIWLKPKMDRRESVQKQKRDVSNDDDDDDNAGQWI